MLPIELSHSRKPYRSQSVVIAETSPSLAQFAPTHTRCHANGADCETICQLCRRTATSYRASQRRDISPPVPARVWRCRDIATPRSDRTREKPIGLVNEMSYLPQSTSIWPKDTRGSFWTRGQNRQTLVGLPPRSPLRSPRQGDLKVHVALSCFLQDDEQGDKQDDLRYEQQDERETTLLPSLLHPLWFSFLHVILRIGGFSAWGWSNRWSLTGPKVLTGHQES